MIEIYTETAGRTGMPPGILSVVVASKARRDSVLVGHTRGGKEIRRR